MKSSSISRFEEVKEEEATKPQKRPRESDAVDVEVPKLSKAEKKNKKQKAEGGVAVPTGEESNEKKEEKKKEKKEKKVGDEPKTKELPGGIKIKDSKVGTGPQAKKGNTVLMRYIGKLQNGKIFDKNVKGKPVCPHLTNFNTAHLTLLVQFTFHLGQGEVIKGNLVCCLLTPGLTCVLDRLGRGHRRNAGGWRAGPHDPTCDGVRQEGFGCYSSELYSYLWYSPFT
jgi:FK506-binding nuclear protein